MEETRMDSLMTKTVALGLALGFPKELIDNFIEEKGLAYTYENFLITRREEGNKHGEWRKDVIDLKTKLYILDLCALNKPEEKKAYESLVNFIKTKVNGDGDGFHEWECLVHDRAFGLMSLYEEDTADERG